MYDRIVEPYLLVRRLYITANHIQEETQASAEPQYEQLDLFTDRETAEQNRRAEEEMLEKERHLQEAVLQIQKKYGKNAILKGTSLMEGATTISRNGQIGGHKA